jgi:type II secretory pathway component GspD/PulD (secretin)
VVISRYQGEKRVSSLPYTLAVNSDNVNSQLNIGANIPVPTTTFTPMPAGADKPAPLVSYNYSNVGTNIDCRVTMAEDGRFELTLSVDESTVVTNTDGVSGAYAGAPVMRSFKSRNRLLLRDGQARQYTAATDRVSGETIRIEVTLLTVK